MQLTRHTDYAFRLLIDLASRREERTQIAEVAAAQAISRTHLMKVVNRLARAGIVEATRGRGGGIRLARRPADINLGEVVRTTEPQCALVDCAGCRQLRRCRLPAVLDQASRAFLQTMESYTLADILDESWPAQIANDRDVPAARIAASL